MQGSQMASMLCHEQASLKIEVVTVAFHWSISLMFSFLLHTKLRKWRQYTARCLDANKPLFMKHILSVATFIFISLYRPRLSSPCVCGSHFYRSFVPMSTGSFSGTTVRGNNLHSSHLNRKDMSINLVLLAALVRMLPSLDRPSRF